MRIPLTTATCHRKIFRPNLPRRFCQTHTFPAHAVLTLNGSHALFRLTRRQIHLFSKKTILRAAHAMGPTVVALAFAGVANLAQAQGTISFSGAQTLMQTVQTFAEYAGAVICLIGLIFAGVSFMSGNIQRGVVGLLVPKGPSQPLSFASALPMRQIQW